MTVTLPRGAGASGPSPSSTGLPGRARRPRREAAPWLVAALAGALVALVSAVLVWPHGTVNLDEIVYLNQADALRHGSLTFDAGTYLPDFRPYLSGVEGDRVVFKYQPLWPAVLAAAQAATGDHRAALVAAGAATALALWLLGREVTGSRWWGTATALTLVVSPVFVSHSGSVLAYLPSAGLAAAGLAAGLRLGRTWSWRWAVAAGALYGLLFFHRPYDAVLGALPVGVWLAWRARRQRRWAPLAALAATALPFVAAWLAYNRMVTGDALTPAFSVGAPDDRFGFGPRASWTLAGHEGSAGMIDFTPLSSAGTVGHFAARSPLWLAGGVVTLGLAGWAVATGRHDRRRLVLAATVATVIAGHWLWWGTENFVHFGLDDTLGPAYWLGALGPVLSLAALGARDLLARAGDLAPSRRRRLLGGLAAAALVSSLVAGAVLGRDIGRAGNARDWQVDVIDAAPARSVLLVPNPPDDPYARAVVPTDLAAAAHLTAVGDGTAAQLFRLRDRFGDRPLWAWRPDRVAGSAFEPTERFELGELPEMAAGSVSVRLAAAEGAAAEGAGAEGAAAEGAGAGGAAAGDGWLRLVDDGEVELGRITLSVVGGTAHGLAVPDAVPATDTGGTAAAPLAVGPEPAWLAAGMTVTSPDGGVETVEVRWAVRARQGTIEVIGPGVGHRHYTFPGGATGWFEEDVSGALTATMDGLGAFAPQRDERSLAW